MRTMNAMRLRWRLMAPALGLVVGVASGCKSEETGGGPNPNPNTPVGNARINAARPVGRALAKPFDATPTPDADGVFYTALIPPTAEDGASTGALFKLGTGAGSTPTMVAEGFNAPVGLAVSTDGQSVFVADVSGTDETGRTEGGLVYRVGASGGTPAELTGTIGYHPRALEVRNESGTDQLYFSGNDPADGVAGVFRTTADGMTISPVLKGAPLADPSGIALAANGDVFVADTVGAEGEAGIYKISGGQATLLVGGLRVGYPAGVAISADGSHLLVSGHVADGAQAAVYRVEIASAASTTITMGIEGNTVSAGVHRAHNKDTFAWANADPAGGTVYLIGTEDGPLP
jgi:sugar lactone lactonase YvrE